jgi:hypothetical protein
MRVLLLVVVVLAAAAATRVAATSAKAKVRGSPVVAQADSAAAHRDSLARLQARGPRR